jgi:hypothetical protein
MTKEVYLEKLNDCVSTLVHNGFALRSRSKYRRKWKRCISELIVLQSSFSDEDLSWINRHHQEFLISLQRTSQ